MSLRFEWDSLKEKRNVQEHRIEFSEAETVFHDDNAKVIDDPDHSIDEDRFIILGLSSRLRILIVCHCYRENDNVIRIISARKASKKEMRTYQGMP